ncbi:MAG TPA: cobalamin biosynthesis protein [Verrucomicrobiae bacterium]|nr:cobalamin biosynthesis protein [Verrucomicrobiae bacterium]
MIFIVQQIILIICLSISFDYVIGEPPNSIHPVVWYGKIINFFTTKIKKNKKSKLSEKLYGSLLALSLTSTIGILGYLLIIKSVYSIGWIGFSLISVFILKSMFSIKSMDIHIKDIIKDIEIKDIEKARIDLSKIVSRDTKNLYEVNILSACIECIAESFVDGILSPLFYYGLLNIPGALIFRMVNTLDSMIGYKDQYNINIGWMSAKMDTIMNFIPSRISIFFLVLATALLNQDWKNAILICKRDRKKTESPNAGIPMSTIAGALKIQVEKIDHYKLGEKYDEISLEKCQFALKITKVATILFVILYLIPITIILNNIQWWSLFFGY